jgi:hypothetical protein
MEPDDETVLIVLTILLLTPFVLASGCAFAGAADPAVLALKNE